jgi:hypothetical protein
VNPVYTSLRPQVNVSKLRNSADSFTPNYVWLAEYFKFVMAMTLTASVLPPPAKEELFSQSTTKYYSETENTHGVALRRLYSAPFLDTYSHLISEGRLHQTQLRQKLTRRSKTTLHSMTFGEPVKLPVVEQKDKLFFPLMINEQASFSAFLDTGSEICLLSENIFTTLKDYENIPDAKVQHTIHAATGDVVEQTRPTKMLTLTVGSQSFQHPVSIVKQPSECLIGLCFFKHATLNLVHNKAGLLEILVGNHIDPRCIISTSSHAAHVPTGPMPFQAVEDLVVAPGETATLSVAIAGDHFSTPQTTGYVHVSSDHEPGSIVPLEGLYQMTSSIMQIRVTNPLDKMMNLVEGLVIGCCKFLSIGNVVVSKDIIYEITADGPVVAKLGVAPPPPPSLKTHTLYINKMQHANIEASPTEEEADIEPEGIHLPSEDTPFAFEDDIRAHATFPY